MHTETMTQENPVLSGRHVRLEPLAHHHVEGLASASASEPALYQWSPVPQGKAEAIRHVEAARAWRDAGSAVPFAILRVEDGVVLGSTRFWNIERWSWPSSHPS